MTPQITPIEKKSRWEFFPGVILEHVCHDMYRWRGADGRHWCYVIAREIVYESTLDAQLYATHGG